LLQALLRFVTRPSEKTRKLRFVGVALPDQRFATGAALK